MIVLLITLLSAGVVLFASICRLTKTTVRTITTVRLSIWLLATSALVALLAPFLWGWHPDRMHAVLLLALALHQVVTRRTWQHGVPEWFLRSHA